MPLSASDDAGIVSAAGTREATADGSALVGTAESEVAAADGELAPVPMGSRPPGDGASALAEGGAASPGKRRPRPSTVAEIARLSTAARPTAAGRIRCRVVGAGGLTP